MSKKAIAIAIAVLCSALALPALAFAWSGNAEAGPIAAGRAVAVLEPPALSADAEAAAPTVGNAQADSQTAIACPGYADTDGDGICDNYGRSGCLHYADPAGAAACPGYTDADGNGICDNYGTPNCPHYSNRNPDAASGNPGYGNGNGYGNGTAPGRGHGHHGGCRR